MDLTLKQTEAVNEIENNLQIIACAGSGKTEVISRRLANILSKKSDVLPESILAFTFTEKAAASMKCRIAKAIEGLNIDISELTISTIHSFCWRLLNKHSDDFQGFRILDEAKHYLFLHRYYKECGMEELSLKNQYYDIICYKQCLDKMVDSYDHRKDWNEAVLSAFKKYRECLYSHKYIDFSMLIFETINQIKTNNSLRNEIEKIKYLVVDEYQDINDIQEQLIRIIADTGANICVVGDDDQTIYRFRGSNANNMITFSDRYKNVHQVRLEQNFRSVPGIVDIADIVISHNTIRLEKKMYSKNEMCESNLLSTGFETEEDMYDYLVKSIKKLHENGISYGDMAILVRKGKRISLITKLLKQASIPCRSRSTEHLFNGQLFTCLVKTVLILNEFDKAKLSSIWNNIIEDDLLTKGFRSLRKSLRGSNSAISEIINDFCLEIGIDDIASNNVEWDLERECILLILEDLDEIYTGWQLNAKISVVADFFLYNAKRVYNSYRFGDDNVDDDAVEIMTVHSSKGLEFEAVFIPNLAEREFPAGSVGGRKYWHVLGGYFETNRDKYEGNIEDERKLFYVAVTRARKDLFLLSLLDDQEISRFVKEAAVSRFLTTDEKVLNYNSYEKRKAEREKENQAKREYWQLVKEARNELYDYYGTATRFFCAANVDLLKIKEMSADDIIAEARKLHII